LPPYTPELQPAETLWTLVDEPFVNKHIPTIEDLEDIITKRSIDLAAERETIKGQAGFHWWPKIITALITRKSYDSDKLTNDAIL
jgi:hypothetical protein